MKTVIKQLSLACAAAAALTLSASPAQATPYFTFSFSGQNEVGGGSFSAVSNGNGSYTVVSGTEWDRIDGVTETETLNLLANPAGANGTTYSPSGAFYYDDQFTPNSDPMLTVGGLMFTGADGLEINIWSTGPGSYVFDRWEDGSYGPGEQSITFTAEDPPASSAGSSVPEPATLALLGLGMLGLAASRRRS